MQWIVLEYPKYRLVIWKGVSDIYIWGLFLWPLNAFWRLLSEIVLIAVPCIRIIPCFIVVLSTYKSVWSRLCLATKAIGRLFGSIFWFYNIISFFTPSISWLHKYLFSQKVHLHPETAVRVLAPPITFHSNMQYALPISAANRDLVHNSNKKQFSCISNNFKTLDIVWYFVFFFGTFVLFKNQFRKSPLQPIRTTITLSFHYYRSLLLVKQNNIFFSSACLNNVRIAMCQLFKVMQMALKLKQKKEKTKKSPAYA